MNLLESADPRSREMIETVMNHKPVTFDVPVDEKHFLAQNLETFLFVDGVLKHSPKINGLNFSKVTSMETSGDDRKLTLSVLHHDLMKDVYELTVDKDTQIKHPVRVLRVLTTGQLTAPTLVIKLAKFAALTVIEETITLDQHNVSVAETHVHLADGAKCEHIHLERAEGNSKLQGGTFAHVSKDAVYKNYAFHLRGALNQRSLDLHIKGTGAHGESNILYLLNGQEKSTVDTVIHHYTPDSTSAQIAKGILDGDSKGAFTGRIHIHKDAQRVNSSQLNKNLILSKKAQAFSEPQLEIFADDVKCSHGSTTGQLSPEEMFYFEARGIPQAKARSLLAMGFAMEVGMKIENIEARDFIDACIAQELRTKYQLGGSL